MLTILSSEKIDLPATAEQWLAQLDSPTVIEIPGKKSGPWRVVSCLIHGNEPSGFFAAFEFLKQSIQPHTSLAIIISSVRAARHKPLFSCRQLAGEFDLNRRFGQSDPHDRVTDLAIQITDYLRDRSPEYIIDLHNTSGDGPAFAVSVSDQPAIQQLASFFSRDVVITHLIVGSLMEQNFNCPIVTIECGGTRQNSSHQVAFDGLCLFAKTPSVNNISTEEMNLFYQPIRVKAQPGMSIDYQDNINHEVQITLRRDIEEFNHRSVQKGEVIGWLDRNLVDCLTATDEQGHEQINQYFEVKGEQWVARQTMKMFMATSCADIALSDCLFYAIKLP